jgi:predicted Zn-dependent peptidase
LTAKWEAFLAPRDIAPATTHKGFRVVQKAAATQEYVLRMTPGPTATDADRYAAKVLATIIGDDSGSRLYWELIDPGLAEHASMHHGDYHGAGMFMTYVSCSPERIADNLWRMDRLLRGVEAEGVAATELQQAKSKINSRLVLRAERPRGRLFNIGANWTYRGEYRSLAEDLAQVEALTVDDLHAVLAKYPLSSGMTYVVGPLAEGDLEGLDT